MIRILFLLVVVLGVGALAYKLYQALGGRKIDIGLGKYKACPRCQGLGYWEGTRSREKCEWCKGSGKLPRDFIEP